tara:strand:- start:1512 stop:1667 length:156 start_codon:yes stop_codon:yes gene_type:complete
MKDFIRKLLREDLEYNYVVGSAIDDEYQLTEDDDEISEDDDEVTENDNESI